MKLGFIAVLALMLGALANAKELFSARCVPALTKAEFSWRVEESGQGVLVRYSDPKKTFSAELSGRDAEELRTTVAGLRLSQADVKFLRSREDKSPGEKLVLLRPFDGATYYFTFRTGEVVEIDNPTFDLEHHSALGQTARLRETMDLLERLTQIATKQNSGKKRT